MKSSLQLWVLSFTWSIGWRRISECQLRWKCVTATALSSKQPETEPRSGQGHAAVPYVGLLRDLLLIWKGETNCSEAKRVGRSNGVLFRSAWVKAVQKGIFCTPLPRFSLSAGSVQHVAEIRRCSFKSDHFLILLFTDCNPLIKLCIPHMFEVDFAFPMLWTVTVLL